MISVVLFAVLPDAVREGERGHAGADAIVNAVDEMTLVVVEAVSAGESVEGGGGVSSMTMTSLSRPSWSTSWTSL